MGLREEEELKETKEVRVTVHEGHINKCRRGDREWNFGDPV